MDEPYWLYPLRRELASHERETRLYEQAAQLRGWATEDGQHFSECAERTRQLAVRAQAEIDRIEARTGPPTGQPKSNTQPRLARQTAGSPHTSPAPEGTTNERTHDMVPEASSFDRTYPGAERIEWEQASAAGRIEAARLESILQQDQRTADIGAQQQWVPAASTADDHGRAR